MMDIDVRISGKKYIAEVWTLNENSEQSTYDEEQYVDLNQWCIDRFGYHARTAYHIFEFKEQSHLEWFVLRWA